MNILILAPFKRRIGIIIKKSALQCSTTACFVDNLFTKGYKRCQVSYDSNQDRNLYVTEIYEDKNLVLKQLFLYIFLVFPLQPFDIIKLKSFFCLFKRANIWFDLIHYIIFVLDSSLNNEGYIKYNINLVSCFLKLARVKPRGSASKE